MKHLIRPLLAILLSFMGSLQAHSQEDLYISTGRFRMKKTIAVDGIYWKGFSTFWENRGDSHFMRYAELAIKEIQDEYLIENGQPSRRPFRRIYGPVKRIPVPGKPCKR